MSAEAYLGHTLLDLGRQARVGIPEAIYAPGKTIPQLLRIAQTFLDSDLDLLVTRVSDEKMAALRKLDPRIHSSQKAHLAWARKTPAEKLPGMVGLLSAGTSDLSVLLEAALCAGFLGCRIRLYSDAGIAGLHRTLRRLDDLKDAHVLIVVAGMEGALPAVVSSLTGKPVIAVPTSTGYGATQGGMATLHAMVGSCSPTVAVVNVDNGFGAACMAASILRHSPRGN